MSALDGKVVAIVGAGSDLEREIAVACAEAGAGIALGSVTPARAHEYAMNSIANEIWAIGREHFVLVLSGAAAAQQLVDAARERLGRCDAIVIDGVVAVDVPVVVPDLSGAATVQSVIGALAGERETPSPPLHATGEGDGG